MLFTGIGFLFSVLTSIIIVFVLDIDYGHEGKIHGPTIFINFFVYICTMIGICFDIYFFINKFLI